MPSPHSRSMSPLSPSGEDSTPSNSPDLAELRQRRLSRMGIEVPTHEPNTNQDQQPLDSPIIVQVCRSQLFTQVCQAFRTLDISRKIIWHLKSDEGNFDKGRGIGVYPDVLSTFWDEFYTSYCLGAEELVPQIRYDVTREEWISIVNVLIKGFQDCGYVPARINKVFLKSCLNGIVGSVSDEDILLSFYKFLSKDDAKTIQSSINGDNVSDEDLLEFLNSCGSKRMSTGGDDLKELVLELGHQELIQSPAFIRELWEQQMKLQNFTDLEIKNILNKNDPCNKDVIQLLTKEEESTSNNETFQWLVKFLRNASPIILREFLRTCTGSDIICVGQIRVSFNATWNEFERRFVGRTCGAVLEIRSTYQSYIEFKSAFERQLMSPYSDEFDFV